MSKYGYGHEEEMMGRAGMRRQGEMGGEGGMEGNEAMMAQGYQGGYTAMRAGDTEVQPGLEEMSGMEGQRGGRGDAGMQGMMGSGGGAMDPGYGDTSRQGMATTGMEEGGAARYADIRAEADRAAGVRETGYSGERGGYDEGEGAQGKMSEMWEKTKAAIPGTRAHKEKKAMEGEEY